MGTERLVVDAGVAIVASGSTAAARVLRRFDLAAPPLLWSEVTSAITEAQWRGQIDAERAAALHEGFDALGIHRRRPADLYRTAVQIAQAHGWAKTYDAEYLALAQLGDARVVTTDRRLLRGAARTGLVIGVEELPAP